MSEFEDYLHGESKVDSMTNPYDAAREAWDHQQAKIYELQKDFNNFKLRAHHISVQRLDIEAFYDYEKNRADRLQARIDAALNMMDAESSNSWGLWKEKADMYEQGASDAYERSYWILKGNKDEN